MRSIAIVHRDAEARALAALSADDRVSLALRLGDDDLEIYRHAQGLCRKDALTALRRMRQAGRVRCTCMEESE
jgi:hypothetical protein